MKPRESGFALLIVLWAMVLLALLGTQLLAAGRTEIRIAANLRGAAQAEALADGATQRAIWFLLADPPRGWRPGDAPHEVALAGGRARIELHDEADRISLNSASPSLMQALLTVLGVEERRARGLAMAIDAWRNPGPAGALLATAAALPYRPLGQDFGDARQLIAVPGITPELLAALLPHLTCFTDAGPRRDTGDAMVARALALAASAPDDTATGAAPAGAGQVIGITATARADGGGVFVRHAVVRVDAGNADLPFQILSWDEGVPP